MLADDTAHTRTSSVNTAKVVGEKVLTRKKVDQQFNGKLEGVVGGKIS